MRAIFKLVHLVLTLSWVSADKRFKVDEANLCLSATDLRDQVEKLGMEPIDLLGKKYFILVVDVNAPLPEFASFRDYLAMVWFKCKYFDKPIMKMFRDRRCKVSLI